MRPETRRALLALYDVPDPRRPGHLIPGYDRDHAERTTRIVLRVAGEVGLDRAWLDDLEVTCLLHDLGRAGMDPTLFGRIFATAERHGLPVRLPDLRARYPDVPEDRACAFFLGLLAPALREEGLPLTARVRDHVAMRMDFKGRLRAVLAARARDLEALGVTVKPWMQAVMLYYYYPHEMAGQPPEVRLMGELLVACENFEAYNNSRRGRDYYGRSGERLRDVFATLDRFHERGLVSGRVLDALRRLTGSGALDPVIREARGLPPDAPLPRADVAYQRELARAHAAPPGRPAAPARRTASGPVHRVEHDGTAIEFVVARSRRRRRTIAIVVDGAGPVRVLAPVRVPLARLREFVASRAAWVARTRERLAQRPERPPLADGAILRYLGRPLALVVEPSERSRPAVAAQDGHIRVALPAALAPGAREEPLRQALARWYRRAAEPLLRERVEHWAARLGLRPSRVLVWGQRSRWGSCAADGTLRLSWRIVQAPPELVDYVVVHELAHLAAPNHGPAFWREVARALPDHRERRRRLRQLAPALPL